MGWPTLALSLTTLTLVSSYHLQDYGFLPPVQKHIPPSEAPSFQRTSVEGLPLALGSSNNYKSNVYPEFEFGSTSLPLRDAVEASPRAALADSCESAAFRDSLENTAEILTRGTLQRDAVEKRPPPPLKSNIVQHESIWLEQLSPPIIRRNQGPPKVVCYYNADAVYRDDPFSLLPKGIPARHCTHLIYNAATIDSHQYIIKPRDPEYNVAKGGYKSVVGLRRKNPLLQILTSITSSNHTKTYKELINCYRCSQQFIQSTIKFLEDHKLDGLQIEWKSASSYQLKALLRSLYTSLSSRGYTLAVVLRPNDFVDPELAEISDFILLRSWHLSYQKISHSATLEALSSFTQKWLDADVSPQKLVIDLPLFGKSYTLKYENSTEVGSPTLGPGIAGSHTKQRGILAYYEICTKLEELWDHGRDKGGPYIKLGDQWIAYDDPISVKIKIAYIKSTNLGGVSLTSLDFDDFVGICGDPWPILKVTARGLGIYDTPIDYCEVEDIYSDPDNCAGFLVCDQGKLYRGQCNVHQFYNSKEGRCVDADPEVCRPGNLERYTKEIDYLAALREKQRSQYLRLDRGAGSRVVCYITSWALYRKGDGKFVPEHLDTRLCTDVIYAFAGLNPDTLTLQPFDPWADIDHGLYERITSMKDSRVLLAIGGWTDSAGDKYSRLISNESSRKKFIETTINFLHGNNFDGLSFEWNYPKCWQSDCKKGPDSDRPNFTKFIKELSRAFDQTTPPLTLAVTLSGYKEVIDRAYDVREISEAVDFISVMTYDYHGAWESQTGHLAPLYARPDDKYPHYNVNWTVNYLVDRGAQKSKLIIGIPFYGQAYRLATPEHSRLGDPATGPGTPGEFTGQPGMLAYYEICDRIKKRGWKTGPGPSAYHKDQFVAYDDAKGVAEKGAWIKQNGFGGAMAWTVDLDDFTNRCCVEPFPLLRSLNRALGRLLDSTPFGENCQRPSEPVTPQPPTLTTHSDANDGVPRPTRPVTSSSTSKPTTWPTWTEKPTKKPSSSTTSWPSWTWSTWYPSTTTTTTSTTIKAPEWTEWTTKKPTTTETSAGSTTSGSSCNFGEYAPDPANCRQYYRCVLGEFRRQSCTQGLHWDSIRSRCDWPATARCQQGVSQSPQKPWTQKPITTTTKRPITTTTTTTTTTNPTTSMNPMPGKPCSHGQYYAYPESCTHFLICANDHLVKQQCGPGLNWNDEKKMCDWAFMNPCKDRPKKNAPLMMKDKDNSGSNNNNNNEEPCTPGSISSVPGDCQSYHACLWGRHQKFSCAPGLHFNKEAHLCDWPHRANCDDQSPMTEDSVTEDSAVTEHPVTTSKPTMKPTKKPTTTTQNWWIPSSTTTTTTTTRTTTTTTQNPWAVTTSSPKPLPSAEIDPTKVSTLSGYFKVVCYFTNWAWYRRGIGKYLPEHIDHTLCTHIIYGFAVLDYSELIIRAHDSWADYDNRFYERVVAYKKRGVKVSLALGGWNDSAGDKYSRLVNSPSSRRKFIEHTIKFIEKYNFDGLDLDWEYPVCWQVDCKKGPQSDKEGFASLLRELSAEFKPRGLLLSAAVSPSKTVIDKGYDVPALNKYLDWIAVMAYDYHGQWDKKTGHVAPLYYHEKDEVYFFNANYTINYWISKGASPRNIVMGMPLYGQAFTIHDPSAGTGLNAPASAGLAGEFTKAAGFLAYYEICDRIRNHGWKVVQDPQRRMGPYAHKGNQWVSFDDADMIRQKAQFVRDMNLGGGMVWALDLDDFRNRCGEGRHPLMQTLQLVLSDPPNKHDRPIKPPAVGQDLDWEKPSQPAVFTSMSPHSMDDKVTTGVKTEEDEYKVVCYFTNWAWYRQEGGKFLPENIDSDLCTHVIYGFAVLDGTTLTIKPHDSWADIDNKFYERVVALKAKGIKVLIAIGGWNDSAGDKYSRLVNSVSAIARFVTHVTQFVEKYSFDGLDLDWEYPVCWQVDCEKGPASDKEGFTMLVKELSKSFKPKGLLLSSAVSPSKRVINHGYDVPALAKYLDWISVMTYDFHGQWDKKTGHVAPLYVRPDDWEMTFNANFSIRYWIQQGAPPKKLVMGAPLYGQSFSLAERNQHDLNAPTYGGGEAGDATRARGFLAYYEICERTLKRGWTVVQDPERRIGPYAYKGDQWVSFDDAEQIKLKAEFIKSLGLAGGMIWALDLDDFENRCGCEPSPLLRTMNRVLRNYPAGPTCSVTGSKVPEIPPISTTTAMDHTSWEQTTSWDQTTVSTTHKPMPVEPDDSVEVIAGPQPPPMIPIGECEDKQFVPHAEDCSKYVLCNFGQLSVLSCPNGLHWNTDHCDWPENSQCKKKSEKIEESNVIPDLPGLPSQIHEMEQVDRGNKKVICYFTNWAWYRPGKGKYLPEDINGNLCTHIIYGFTVLDPNMLTIKMHDTWADVDNNFYERVTAYKAQGIKVLVALGGWNDSAGDKYSRLVNNPVARARFVKHTVQFIDKYQFDGLDFDWEYPVCWQVKCELGPASDKKAFVSLIKELSSEFRPRGWLLSAAVSPSKRVIDHGYDVPALAKYLDWIAVMAYDFHGHWEQKTGHVAPLYYYPGDEFDYFNGNFSMRYWIEKGASPSKLVMGIPLYGQSFTLSSTYDSGLQAPAPKPGQAGTYTRSPGFLAFYEVCEKVKNGWKIIKDPAKRIGPYAVRGDQWVSYDDVSNVIAKASFIRELGLAGGMVWALDLDDFNGNCGCGKYPLLRALNRGLGGFTYRGDCT
ncbi:probable chitinase 10 [Microplitis demolitor]|uniref:probable chitinase 10 n=1 Tax=Microplitis demolitor TaxID=69319 RepID=UPI0004CD7833|nr:probable chitinase 10 [Microplitis demolitor]